MDVLTSTDPRRSLTADEIDAARAVLAEAGLAGPTVRFVYVGLDEPAKAEVLAARRGDGPAPDRRVRAMLLDLAGGRSLDVRVSVDAREVVALHEIDGSDGHLPIALEEFDHVGEILQDDPRWLAALEVRGIDPALVVFAPLSAGFLERRAEGGRRIVRVMGFRMDHPTDSPWAHPIDGLSAHVDPVAREVIEVEDLQHLPVPAESGSFQDPELAGPPLEGLKPIEITQPEGPSFTIDGETIEWASWRLSVGFDPREGVVLRDVGFRDGDEVRSILYRASVAEMVVPYGDPSPQRFWHNYFDTGEYLFGRFTNSLELGCDCVGEIRYLDAVLSDELGLPKTIRNAICVHEEDMGVLWKHTDQFTGVSEVRRQRRLVVSFFTTIGNYDYGFFWYFHLDGTIELEAKLTGILFTSSYPQGHRFATEVAPGLGAPYHQHLFNARLDLAVDGHANAVDEIDAVPEPLGDTNPWGNAFTRRATRIRRESEAAREADATVGRTWQIVSTERTNRLGGPTGYALHAQHNPTLLADPSSSIARRAGFATKQVWVTRYADDERYPAGDLINQHPGGGGLPSFVQADRDLDGQDIVLWHTFGPTHFPRIEDWPVMPVDRCGFMLKPSGFFDRNPTLNVPPSMEDHCAPGGHGAHEH